MRIERVVKQSDNEYPVKVFFDTDETICVSDEEFYKYKLFENEEFTPEGFHNTVIDIQTDRAFFFGLKSLLLKRQTRSEITEKMLKREYDGEAVENAADKLEQQGYIDDEDYCRRFIRTSIKAGRKSSAVIYNNLVNKGIDKQILEKILLEYDLNDVETAKSLISKKYGFVKNKSLEYNDKMKIKRYLYGKGFSLETIETALDIFIEENEIASSPRDKFDME